MEWTLSVLQRKEHCYPTIDFSNASEKHFNKEEKSKIPCLCRICGNRWSSFLRNIVELKTTCRKCLNGESWTHQRLLRDAYLLPLIDFRLVTHHHFDRASYSHIPCICRRCNRQWSTVIGGLFRRKGKCPVCETKEKWTYNLYEQAVVLLPGVLFDKVLGSSVRQKKTLSASCLQCNCKLQLRPSAIMDKS